ncbi:MAG: hypothetical protein J1E61_11125 [Lachnospiraceae bacterium]|nr:hypothetical protein [Lachnospiraceae bacterium]
MMKRFVLAFCILSVLFSACGKADEAELDMAADKEIQKEIEDTDLGTEETAPEIVEPEVIEELPAVSANAVEVDEEKVALMKEMFGKNCIAEQTFEVELSEYEGKVWFVPFYPSETDESFYFQIIQNGEVLFLTNTHNATSCVPEGLLDEGFTSLDAVEFFDVNYDGETDIVLIETYGDTSFAIVYYGEVSHYDDRVFFYSQEVLSSFITDHVKTLTIPEIQQFLTKGTANGEFTDYREAYRAVCRLELMEKEPTFQKQLLYNLLYVDEDDIPELVIGHRGYFVTMYTYHDGTIYKLMDQWGYGAFGNSGYEYIPKKNLLRNFDQDYAGLVLYTTYMTVNSQYAIETVAVFKDDRLDCVDENGDFVDEGAAKYSIDGEEVPEERYDAAWKKYGHEAGEYKYISPEMDLDTLLSELSK